MGLTVRFKELQNALPPHSVCVVVRKLDTDSQYTPYIIKITLLGNAKEGTAEYAMRLLKLGLKPCMYVSSQYSTLTPGQVFLRK